MLGVHSSKVSVLIQDKPTLKKAVERDIEKFGLTCAQIFLAGPRSNVISKEIKENVQRLYKKMPIIVHSPYTLASLWTNTDAYLPKLEEQLSYMKNIFSEDLVVHLPSDVSGKIDNVIKVVKQVISLFEKYNVNMCLEHVASSMLNTVKSWNTFCTKLFTAIDSDHLKLVIDTAHLWASGLDITTYDVTEDWLKSFKYIDKIEVLHLNGISCDLGSRRDKHQIVMCKEDKIWGQGITYKDSGLRSFLQMAKKKNWVVILEINVGNVKDLDNVLDTLKKELGIVADSEPSGTEEHKSSRKK